MPVQNKFESKDMLLKTVLLYNKDWNELRCIVELDRWRKRRDEARDGYKREW